MTFIFLTLTKTVDWHRSNTFDFLVGGTRFKSQTLVITVSLCPSRQMRKKYFKLGY
jgi:hypothetical protein